MTNPSVADYLFWPLNPVRIWRNLERADCLNATAYERPSLAIAEIEKGIDGYRILLDANDDGFAPGSQPSPCDQIVRLLTEKGLANQDSIETLRQISVGGSQLLFHALTRNCQACGQRNFVASPECWACDAVLPDAPNLTKWNSIPAYLLAPQDLHIEKRLAEKTSRGARIEYGPELRFYEDQ